MKIFLIGWFGAGNAGDEAILISELLRLREGIEKAEFFVLSFAPERTGRLTGGIPEVKRIIRMGSKRNVIRSDVPGLMRAFRQADAVIVGGGGIFQDIYNHYPIPFFTAMALLAKIHRKPLVFYCLGIGPIRTPLGRRLCRLAAGRADMISVRDPLSRELLRELGVDREIHLSADPAFTLEPAPGPVSAKFLEELRAGGGGPLIGVCLQDLLDWDDRRRKALAACLDTLARERGARIAFLPLGSYRDSWRGGGPADTVDAAACRKVAAMMSRGSLLLEEELPPGEILSLFKGLDLVISMRFHGLVLGLAAGLPVVALTYAEETKTSELMRRIGEEKNLFDVRLLDEGDLSSSIGRLLEGGAETKERFGRAALSLRREVEAFNTILFRWLNPRTTAGPGVPMSGAAGP